MNFLIKNTDELPVVAKELISKFKHKIILFEGELGAGKTTLIKELVKQLGSEDEVSSPTFSIVNEYDSRNGKIFHFDFYRIKSEEEALDFGTEEYLDSGNWCFIEWPDKIKNLLFDDFHKIKIISEDDTRNIIFD